MDLFQSIHDTSFFGREKLLGYNQIRRDGLFGKIHINLKINLFY